MVLHPYADALNLVPDDSSKGQLSHAFPGIRSTVRDLPDSYLGVGPLVPLNNPGRLWSLRGRDFERCFSAEKLAIIGLTNEGVTRGHIEAHTALTRDLRAATNVRLWMGDSGEDGVSLAFALALLREEGLEPQVFWPDPGVLYGLGPGVHSIGGISDLRQRAGTLTWRRLSRDDHGHALRLWDTLVSPDGEAHVDPFPAGAQVPGSLRRAWQLHLDGFPDATRGLSTWQLYLLEEIDEKPAPMADLLTAFFRTKGGEGSGGTFTTIAFLQELVRADHPLIAAQGELYIDRGEVEIALTPEGLAVREGRLNALDLMEIDRWVGGIHLSSQSGEIWVRDGGELRRR